MEKVYLYVHDEKGYGHLSRMLKIYHTLSPYFDTCILLSGTLKIQDPSVQYIQLPYVTEFEPMLLDRTPIEKELKKRREYIQSKLAHGEKFSLYIDYFPYGRHAFYKEIDMLIDMSQSSWWQTYCVMRDIFMGVSLFSEEQYLEVVQNMREYYYPKSLDELIWSDKEKIFQYLVRYSDVRMIVDIFLDSYLRYGKIDKVLVFWDRDVYDIRDETPLSSKYADKFVFLWYLLPKSWNVLKTVDSEPYVLISAGGNIFDIKKFLSLLVLCSCVSWYRFKIVIGGMLEKKLWSQIRDKFPYEHMEFVDFCDDFAALLSGAAVFVGGGGYGTCTDLMQYNIPGFLYINYNQVVDINKTEQYMRIASLSKYLDIQYIESFDSTTMKDILRSYAGWDRKEQHNIQNEGAIKLLEFLWIKN